MEICQCKRYAKLSAELHVFTVGTYNHPSYVQLPEGACIKWVKNSLGKFDVRISIPVSSKPLTKMELLGGRSFRPYEGGITSIKYVEGKFPYA